LSKEENRMLAEMVEKAGGSVSDVVREMIRKGYEWHSIVDALREIRSRINAIAAENGNGNSETLQYVKKVVTMIGMAMPSVAKHMPTEPK
jgi:hypothetical protein